MSNGAVYFAKKGEDGSADACLGCFTSEWLHGGYGIETTPSHYVLHSLWSCC